MLVIGNPETRTMEGGGGTVLVKNRFGILGAEHLDTLKSNGNPALTYSKQGHWKETEEPQVKWRRLFSGHLGPNPQAHWRACWTTQNVTLTYRLNDSTKFVRHGDSDWGSDTDNHCSTTGDTFILAGGAIAWANQKQHTVALSLRLSAWLSVNVQNTQWMLSLLTQLDFNVDLPLQVFRDSSGAKEILANNVFHKWTKHIDICYHYMWELINKCIINILPVSSKENIADLLTKSLPQDQHHYLARKFGLVDSSSEYCKTSHTWLITDHLPLFYCSPDPIISL